MGVNVTVASGQEDILCYRVCGDKLNEKSAAFSMVNTKAKTHQNIRSVIKANLNFMYFLNYLLPFEFLIHRYEMN
jgi:uncharacterized protein YmfQ (DUF2313 family)